MLVTKRVSNISNAKSPNIWIEDPPMCFASNHLLESTVLEQSILLPCVFLFSEMSPVCFSPAFDEMDRLWLNWLASQHSY